VTGYADGTGKIKKSKRKEELFLGSSRVLRGREESRWYCT